MTTATNYVILGAAGGIGAATVRRLRSQDANVLLAGRTEASLAKLSQEVGSPYRVVDATNLTQVDALLRESADLMQSVDGVVNCVGSLLLKPAHLTTDHEWQETMALNLTTAFATVHGAVKVMRQSGGAIVLISSAAAELGLPNHEAIAAAKAGVNGLVRAAAASYASRGIRVNSVAPGLVRTNMTHKIWSTTKAAESSRGMHALGRLGEPDDVASLICWLLDPANNWITGQTIGIDGGLGSVRTSAKS